MHGACGRWAFDLGSKGGSSLARRDCAVALDPRFDREPDGPGAEVEASRGCPYHCTFCAKENFRDAYRRRDLDILLAEIDGLLADDGEELFGRDAEPRQPLGVLPGRLCVPRPARDAATSDQGPNSIEKNHQPKNQ